MFPQLILSDEIRKPSSPPALMEKVHLPFMVWFSRLLVTGELSETQEFTITKIRTQYTELCWSEEILWKAWCDNVHKGKQFQVR